MREIPIVLIGHKDHGKSTLIGRLLLDTNSVKENRVKEIREVDNTSGQKFELAHLVDSFKEEREREMTMDTTQALLKGEKRFYQLIDVPGHQELISHMLTGASKAEAAILLVSIEEGIKEQTRQHLEVAKLLGIGQLAVAVNKIDKKGYRKEDFEEIVSKIKEILEEIGYSPENTKFFPISAWGGDNVVRKSKKTPWYQGESLMDFLENKIKEPRPLDSFPLTFLVQDKYIEKEEEILVGKIESGRLIKGREILFLPERKKTKVREIKDSEGALEEAEAGRNVGITLFDNLGISRGAVGTVLDSSLQIDEVLAGEIFWIDKPSQRKLILECGTAQVEGKLQKPELINQGEKTLYQISLKKPIAFDSSGRTILGKIVLKDEGKIIAVGNIKQNNPIRYTNPMGLV